MPQITEEARVCSHFLIPLCFGETKIAVVMLPLLIVFAHPSAAMKVNHPILLLSALETMRRQWLFSHFSFSVSFTLVNPFMDHENMSPLMFGLQAILLPCKMME